MSNGFATRDGAVENGYNLLLPSYLDGVISVAIGAAENLITAILLLGVTAVESAFGGWNRNLYAGAAAPSISDGDPAVVQDHNLLDD